ncbi:MAG TPA: sugar ABC transporter substrate-binding protein, partial [Gammaproteobacteria bacterium]|nr:sugar ABC transporter substrate-binding protein [Gammaproteobacteria bacterium]
EMSGFFSLSNHFFEVDNPIAKKMMSWREQCDSTIRNTAQGLTRGEPNLELEVWETSLGVMTNTMTPVQAVARLQRGLESWHEPQKRSKKQQNSFLNCGPTIVE